MKWRISARGSGQSVTLTIEVKTGGSTGAVSNTASVGCSVESNLSNNSASATTSVR
jgi:hypothetical protein